MKITFKAENSNTISADFSPELISRYKKYVRVFQLCVTQTSTKFNSFSSYWLTSFSARDRYNSDIQTYFMQLAQLEHSIELDGSSLKSIYCKDYLSFQIVSEYLKRHKTNITISTKEKALLLFKFYLSNLKKIKNIIVLARELFFIFIYNISKSHRENNIQNLDYLFVCPLDLPFVFDEKQIYKDRYFGYLPYKFYKSGKKISIAGTLPAGIKIFQRKSNPPKEFPVFPILSYLGLLDLGNIFFISLKEILLPPKINLKRKNAFKAFHKIVNHQLFHSYSERIMGRILFLCIKKILQKSPKVSLIHTFENNPWERAVIQAFRKYTKGGRIIGYLHCAVLESHQKNYTDKIELKRRPFPDKVYTTGFESKKTLLKLGVYPVGKIKVGEDLRGPKIKSIPLKTTRPKSIKRILFLMEGLTSMEIILRIIVAVKQIKPEIIFSVRPHPALSWNSAFLIGLDSLLSGMIEKLDPSESMNLQLENADAVIYRGSTAVMYAAYAGIPLLRYRDNWWLSDDPLVFGEVIKEDFITEEELLQSIVRLESIADNDYIAKVEKQRTFIKNYLRQSRRIYL